MVHDRTGIPAPITAFFEQFHLGAALHQAGIRKRGGVSPRRLVLFLLGLVFTQRNFYRLLKQDPPDPAVPTKNTVYRFLNNPHYNWRRALLTISRAVIQWLTPLVDPARAPVLIIDDPLYDRHRSRKVELLAKVYDHVEHVYRWGFRLLTLGWSDGNTFVPVAFSLLSSEKAANRRQGVDPRLDKRTVGYRRRREGVQKAPVVVLQLLREALAAGIPARYVLFDSWFAMPRLLRDIVADTSLHVVAMVKAMTTIRYTYRGRRYDLDAVYQAIRKRPGKARILAEVVVELETQAGAQTVKLVFVRDRRKGAKRWLALITTDVTLAGDEVIRLYGKRWETEVFFRMAKSTLNLVREFQGRSYDQMVAHTTLVFLRYQLLAVAARAESDARSIGTLFWATCEEVADLRFLDAWHLLLEALRDALSEELHLSPAQLDRFLTAFFARLPAPLRHKLAV